MHDRNYVQAMNAFWRAYARVVPVPRYCTWMVAHVLLAPSPKSKSSSSIYLPIPSVAFKLGCYPQVKTTRPQVKAEPSLRNKHPICPKPLWTLSIAAEMLRQDCSCTSTDNSEKQYVNHLKPYILSICYSHGRQGSTSAIVASTSLHCASGGERNHYPIWHKQASLHWPSEA